MGFFSDWIENVDKLRKDFERVMASKMRFDNEAQELYAGNVPEEVQVLLPSEKQLARVKRIHEELEIAEQTARNMRHSRIIKVPAEQLMLFANLDRIEEQDYLQLRSPFPYVYVEPVNGEMLLDEYFQWNNVPVKGILISHDQQVNRRHMNERITFGAEFNMNPMDIQSVFQITWFIPIPGYADNTYVTTVAISKDGKLYSPNLPDEGEDFLRQGQLALLREKVPQGQLLNGPDEWRIEIDQKTTRRMITWLIHIVNYLTSPAVILEEREASAALQKARQKRGKEPLPGWYEIAYKQARFKTEVLAPGTGTRHGFRYDVRGHFMHFTKGRMAGRVIWCPPHQRGVQNTLYKPKVYRVETELPDQPEVYGG